MVLCSTFVSIAALMSFASVQEPKPEFPPFAEVAKGFERVVSSERKDTLWTIWHDAKNDQLLAELPSGFAAQRFYVVPTVAAGDEEAGVYSIWHRLVGQGARYHYWKRYGKELALMEPELGVRTTGDAQSKSSTARIYTDRLILSLPIVCLGPGGGPVIDLDHLLVKQSGNFFGPFLAGAKLELCEVSGIKAFPHNVEAAFTLPRRDGRLATVHYSIGAPPKSPDFVPREADRRVGFYYQSFVDRGKNDGESQVRRYADRWNLTKADPSLRLSPPKQPIVYYLEHTTPVRYRRWVRDGVLAWNEAFERVGIVGAIEVRQQDATTGAYMDVDPEDIRHSFVRWTNSHMGFAIGPSHAHPETGEIYEADIVMDEAFIGGFASSYQSTELASAAMLSFSSENADWLLANDAWDPRVRLAAPEEREEVLAYRRALASGEADPASAPPTMRPEVWPYGSPGAPGDARAAQRGFCACARLAGQGSASMRLALDAGLVALPAAEDESLLDGLPESFVGPLLQAVVMHEVGHTLGLMHNWKGSSLYSHAEINSAAMRGVKSSSATVMDYMPTNIVVADGELVQGDYDTIGLGPYDFWAIEWGYGDEPSKVAARSAEPGHAFMAEDGQSGPDPHAKTWDLGEFSLDFSRAEMRFVEKARARLLDDFVADGESWDKVRRGYGRLLGKQMTALYNAANWIGGAHVSRSFKGDEGAPEPFRPVDVKRQREALAFFLATAFQDASFGLEPELLAKLVPENWYDEGFATSQDWPIHDQVLGLQASALSMLLSPTRLRRVDDNVVRLGPGADALTLAELLVAVRDEIWSEVSSATAGSWGPTRPMISSLRRNLQREHLDRLVDLATGFSWPNATARSLEAQARTELETIERIAERALDLAPEPASRAHLAEARARVARALEAGWLRRR